MFGWKYIFDLNNKINTFDFFVAFFVSVLELLKHKISIQYIFNITSGLQRDKR